MQLLLEFFFGFGFNGSSSSSSELKPQKRKKYAEAKKIRRSEKKYAEAKKKTRKRKTSTFFEVDSPKKSGFKPQLPAFFRFWEVAHNLTFSFLPGSPE